MRTVKDLNIDIILNEMIQDVEKTQSLLYIRSMLTASDEKTKEM